MEEVFGFGLLGLIVFTFGLGIKRWLKPKKDLFEYEDEIILDDKMVHFGPFSGNPMYKHHKFILLLTVSSSFLSADWTRTIDGWGIDSYSNENLILHKTGNDTSTNFYLEMARPFCVTSEPNLFGVLSRNQNKSLKNIHVSKFYVNNAFIPVNLTIAPNGSINVGKHFRGYIDVGNALWRVSSTIGY